MQLHCWKWFKGQLVALFSRFLEVKLSLVYTILSSDLPIASRLRTQRAVNELHSFWCNSIFPSRNTLDIRIHFNNIHIYMYQMFKSLTPKISDNEKCPNDSIDFIFTFCRFFKRCLNRHFTLEVKIKKIGSNEFQRSGSFEYYIWKKNRLQNLLFIISQFKSRIKSPNNGACAKQR